MHEEVAPAGLQLIEQRFELRFIRRHVGAVCASGIDFDFVVVDRRALLAIFRDMNQRAAFWCELRVFRVNGKVMRTIDAKRECVLRRVVSCELLCYIYLLLIVVFIY